MAGCVVNPPAVSDGSSGAVGTIDTRSAAEAFLFFFFLAGAKEKLATWEMASVAAVYSLH